MKWFRYDLEAITREHKILQTRMTQFDWFSEHGKQSYSFWRHFVFNILIGQSNKWHIRDVLSGKMRRACFGPFENCQAKQISENAKKKQFYKVYYKL